jgi:hypothetical protein
MGNLKLPHKGIEYQMENLLALSYGTFDVEGKVGRVIGFAKGDADILQPGFILLNIVFHFFHDFSGDGTSRTILIYVKNSEILKDRTIPFPRIQDVVQVINDT